MKHLTATALLFAALAHAQSPKRQDLTPATGVAEIGDLADLDNLFEARDAAARLTSTHQTLTRLRAQSSADQWAFIRTTFGDYYGRNKTNVFAAGFARIMLENAERGYAGRKEAGGWAGEFICDSFLTAAADIAGNPEFWKKPVTQQDVNGLAARLGNGAYMWLYAMLVWLGSHMNPSQGDLDTMGTLMIQDLSAMFAAGHHFERHLKPSFLYVIRKQMTEAPDDYDALAAVIRGIAAEHDTHLENALIPASDADDEISLLLQRIIDGYTPFKARQLRRHTFQQVLQEMEDAGKMGYALRSELMRVVRE